MKRRRAALLRAIALGVSVGALFALGGLMLGAYEQEGRALRQQTVADTKRALRAQLDADTTTARQAPRTTENPTFTFPQGTPASIPTGIIRGGAPAPVPAAEFISFSLWQGYVGNNFVAVYSGAPRPDPDQGKLIVYNLSPDLRSGTMQEYLTAVRGGPVEIYDAVGSQLFLRSTDGTRYTFDAVARQLVLQHVTSLAYSGASTGDFNDLVTLSALLRDSTSGQAIAAKDLRFALGAQTCVGWTDANGSASCTLTPAQAAGTYELSVSYSGEPGLLATSITILFTVTPEETEVRYTGPLDVANHATVTLSGVLREDATTPVAGRIITLAYGSQSCAGATVATGAASCQVVVSQPLGAVTATAIFAGDAYYRTASASSAARVHADTTVTNQGATTSDYHDAATLSATLLDSTDGNLPVPGKSLTFGLGAQSCVALTDASGKASCSITPSVASGSYTLTVAFGGDASYNASSAYVAFIVTTEETTLLYTGDLLVARGATATLSGLLKEDNVTPISGRTLTFSFGSQNCIASTDSSGVASCTIVATQPLGPVDVSVSFDGDPYYRASSASARGIEYDYSVGGAFVVGDVSATSTGTVTFWGDDWAKLNALSGGAAPSSFKGFENSSAIPSCGANWPTDPGNSSGPPSTIPSYMAVVVTSGVTKSGEVISGDTAAVVIVVTDAGYDSNPGHSGTGRIIATLCRR